MSLSQILKTLGSGHVLNNVGLLQTLVHAVIDEISQIRDDIHNQNACHTDSTIRLEDRTNASITGCCQTLDAKFSAAVHDLTSRIHAIETTLATHVDLESAIARQLALTRNTNGKLHGYNEPKKE